MSNKWLDFIKCKIVIFIIKIIIIKSEKFNKKSAKK